MTHRAMFSILLTALVCTLLPVPRANAQEVAWSYRASGGYIDASPGIADINGDGLPDIVVATTSGDVIVLDRDGKEFWHRSLSGRLSVAPTVANICGDSTPEILIMNRERTVFCLDGATGNPLWEHTCAEVIEWGATAPVAADLGHTGRMSVIVCDNSGTVACLDGEGKNVWSRTLDIGNPQCPAVADVMGDEKLEILVAGSKCPLVCLSDQGEELWRVQSQSPGSSPLVCDVNRDGAQEVLSWFDGKLNLLKNDGSVIWTAATKGKVDSGLTAADLIGDGMMEIVAADTKGGILCLNSDGKTLWTGDAVERVRRSPAVADVDGDGVIEVLVAGYSGILQVFGADGTPETSVTVPGGSMNSTPTTVDLNGNGQPYVLCPTKGGNLTAYRWPVINPGVCRILQGGYRGGSTRTGAIRSEDETNKVLVRRVDTGRCYVGVNEYTVEIANPSAQSLRLVLEVSANNGAPTKSETESSEPDIKGQLTYVLTGDQPEALRFTFTLFNGDLSIAQRSQTLYALPFRKELDDLDADLRTIEGHLARLSDPRGIVERVAYLRSKMPEYSDRTNSAGTTSTTERHALRDELHALLKESAQMACLTRYAAEAAQGIPFMVHAANPWTPFGGLDELTEGRTDTNETTVNAFKGESEVAAFNVYNLSGSPAVFRVEATSASPLPDGVKFADVLAVSEAVTVPTQSPADAADALPLLNQGGLLTVPAWGVRQVWVDVSTKQLPPGEHKLALRMRTVAPVSKEIEARINLTVWSAALPEQQALRLCHWGYVHTSFLKDYPENALNDQIALGTNVFVGITYPKATFDADGNLGPVDYTEHDAYVKRHAPHGMILFCGYMGALTGPAKPGTDVYRRAHVAWLREWVKHLAELGVGYDKFALYPVDEPGLSEGLVELYIQYAELAREADPKILMYTDPVSQITLDELKRIAPLVDIWCPNRFGFLLDVNQDKLALIKGTGKPVWTYECEDNVKHQTTLGYYRAQAWLAWHHGLTGIGFWSYCTSVNDPWFTPADGKEYLITYPGANSVVRSKRWYAIRDGIEDYAMLGELRKAADAARAAGAPAEAVTEADQLLGPAASDVARFCRDDNTQPDRSGQPGMRKRGDAQFVKIQMMRMQMNGIFGKLAK